MLRMQSVGPTLILSVISIVCSSSDALAEAGAHGAAATVADGEQLEARQRYARGLQLVKEGNYQGALIEMQRAYVLSPTYKIQYNLGQIHSHLGDAAAAVTAYERYLSEGGAEVPPPRATEVSQEVARLRSRVGSVDLSVKTPGADVLVDDAIVGRSPFSKRILLNIGQHRFTVAKAGLEPVTRAIAIAGEDELTLELSVADGAPQRALAIDQQPSDRDLVSGGAAQADRAGAVVQESRPEAQSQSPTGARLTWLGWTITGALAAGAVVSGLVARRDADDLARLRDTPAVSRQDLDSAQQSTVRAALVTDVLIGAAAVAAGVSLYYTLSSGKPVAKSGSSASAGLNVSIGLTGVRVRRAF